jgi:signal transduction histidine kinase
MPDGGEVRVEGRILESSEGPARLEISIADTGQGIPETDLPHVFEPFYSTKPEGSGLGLSVVYRIVQDHGGHVEVRSHPSSGTRVTLVLPSLGPRR